MGQPAAEIEVEEEEQVATTEPYLGEQADVVLPGSLPRMGLGGDTVFSQPPHAWQQVLEKLQRIGFQELSRRKALNQWREVSAHFSYCYFAAYAVSFLRERASVAPVWAATKLEGILKAFKLTGPGFLRIWPGTTRAFLQDFKR